ncbi:MAG: DinB family protein [Ginsengibacter sp.]
MDNSIELTLKIILDAWKGQVSRVDKLLSELADEQFGNEVSPGSNTGVYLLGNLAAVHDALFPLLGVGEKLYRELENIFIKNQDKSGLEQSPVKELRIYWQEVNSKLLDYFGRFSPEEWLQKHTAVNEEAFKEEPHRNRLNVLVSRTNHLAYHFGQLAFLKK